MRQSCVVFSFIILLTQDCLCSIIEALCESFNYGCEVAFIEQADYFFHDDHGFLFMFLHDGIRKRFSCQGGDAWRECPSGTGPAD